MYCFGNEKLCGYKCRNYTLFDSTRNPVCFIRLVVSFTLMVFDYCPWYGHGMWSVYVLFDLSSCDIGSIKLASGRYSIYSVDARSCIYRVIIGSVKISQEFKKIPLKIFSIKCRPFCSGLPVICNHRHWAKVWTKTHHYAGFLHQ